MPEVTYTGQIVREAPEVEAQKAAVIAEAQKVYNAPLSMPAYVAAGLSPTQLQAMALAQEGIGVYEPYFTAAGDAITQGQDLAMLGAQDIYGLNLDPQYQAARDAYSQGLKVMDMTAFTLCKENNLPIIVFDMDTPGNLIRLLEGHAVGTIVRN